ncbi:MAG TPA: glycosyltransferase family 2 protein [Steroidobacteraceae bacterium]|jgi:glycosyltransferase involved in cell wall biosynthesis|nr:glycosyltransferase family 2 protein [Steroidobacteraceae bacterium]
MLPISLVVITYNEQDAIARCLDSVDFAAEKVVVDCGSEDQTCTIAAAHGARVVHQPWLGFGAQRNFADSLASHEWILSLDADEALTPELAQELKARLAALLNSTASAGVLYRTAWFMGRPLHWYRAMVRERKARIYHRGRARWSEARVHESLRYQGGEVVFQAPLMHFLNPTLVHHELKSLRYAELKALDWRDQRHSSVPALWPLVFAFTFLKDYLLRLAVLDGWRGWIVAYLAADYALYKRLRYFEMQRFAPSVELASQELKAHKLER